MKHINEMTTGELKAVAFDIDQQVRSYQNQYAQVLQVLENQLKEDAPNGKKR